MGEKANHLQEMEDGERRVMKHILNHTGSVKYFELSLGYQTPYHNLIIPLYKRYIAQVKGHARSHHCPPLENI